MWGQGDRLTQLPFVVFAWQRPPCTSKCRPTPTQHPAVVLLTITPCPRLAHRANIPLIPLSNHTHTTPAPAYKRSKYTHLGLSVCLVVACCCLLLAQLNAIVLLVPLLEGSGINLDDGVLHQGLRAHLLWWFVVEQCVRWLQTYRGEHHGHTKTSRCEQQREKESCAS